MKNEYKHTKTTVSLINYHFVFCPRYRRKLFNIQGVEDRFKELTIAECDKQGIEILALECHIDHVRIFVSSETIKWYVDTQKKTVGDKHKKRC